MRVLITGGAGYIGGHLAQSLLNDGHDVVVLDTLFNSKDWPELNVSHCAFHNGSVCNIDAVCRAMSGVSVVYHLAARSDWVDNPMHVVRLFNTNVIGTAIVLAAASKTGVDNVIIASSAAVYGDVVGAEEAGPARPINTYGCSKLAAEQAAVAYYNRGMNIKILRLFNVWGGRHSSSVIDLFVGGCRTIYGDGDQTRDFIHISDVMDALRSAYAWDPLMYNIGTGVEVTVGGMFDKLAGGGLEYQPERSFGEIQSSCASMDNTFDRVQWRPDILITELSRKEIVQLCV